MNPPAVFLTALAGLVYFLPAYLATWTGWSLPAVEYVAYGMESTALWVMLATRSGMHVAAQMVCAWGAFEALQRPAARLMFDMTHPVRLPAGMNLAELAFGPSVGWIGLTVAGVALVSLVNEKDRHGR